MGKRGLELPGWELDYPSWVGPIAVPELVHVGADSEIRGAESLEGVFGPYLEGEGGEGVLSSPRPCSKPSVMEKINQQVVDIQPESPAGPVLRFGVPLRSELFG